MNFDYSLIFKYILQYSKQIFLSNKKINPQNTVLLINSNKVYYTSLHLKLSSLFFSAQLIEIFGYESIMPENKNKKNYFIKKNNETVLVYNFNILKNNTKILLFTLNQTKNFFFKKITKKNYLLSITELFSNSNWLERETGELSGIFFYGKKDIRNLMLQYGDSTTPFKKSYPSIGLKEIFYDSVSDLLIQNQTSIQF